MDQLLRRISRLVWLICFLLSLSVLAVFATVQYFGTELPDYRQLESYDPITVTRLYSRDGDIINEYGLEKRIYIYYEDIPEHVIQAFLAAEDRNFFKHKGVDIYSIGRAILQNILNLGKNRSPIGGSTITQQVVKNFLLTNERTLARKIKEAILSYRISKVYSKERILELYLNQIFLGSGAYGVAYASLMYFNKDLSNLEIEEAALLAALPKAPSNLNPRKYQERAKERRDWVLERMVAAGFITYDIAKAAMQKPIALQRPRYDNIPVTEFYAETVKTALSKSILYDSYDINGSNVFTYLDPKLQSAAAKALRYGIDNFERARGFKGSVAHIKANKPEDIIAKFANFTPKQHPEPGIEYAAIIEVRDAEMALVLQSGQRFIIKLQDEDWLCRTKKCEKAKLFSPGDIIAVHYSKLTKAYSITNARHPNGAIVVMEVGSGRVLALVGGYDFSSQFNRATQAMRQSGSVFKTFVHFAALQKKYKPNDIVVDEPISISPGPGLPLWTPKNYGSNFLGPLTLRQALEKSRNIPTVKLATAIGIRPIVETASLFGIYKQGNLPNSISVALGAYETTLLNMTNAYNIIASQGLKIRPRFIDRIYDRHGNLIYNDDFAVCTDCDAEQTTSIASLPHFHLQQEQLADPRTCYQIASILEGVVQRGTATSARKLGRKYLAGKTGTTNQSFDTWFVGFTADIVVGVYIGYDQPQSLGQKATGATVALPVFNYFMEQVAKYIPDRPFTAPPAGIYSTLINYKTGQPIDHASKDQSSIIEYFKEQNPSSMLNYEAVESEYGDVESEESYTTEEDQDGDRDYNTGEEEDSPPEDDVQDEL